MKTRLLIFSMLLLLALHADDGLPNPSIRPEAQSKTIDIFAEALYWYTGETVDWAFTNSYPPNTLKTSYNTFTFDWAPGFRVGLGYNMEHDQWDTQASFTWFRSRASGKTSGNVTTAFLGARLSLLEPFARGEASLKIHYNIFDWDLGRSFLISKHLALRPSIGLKGGWIDQTLHSGWSRDLLNILPIVASENLKQRFRTGGPKANITAKWCFGNLLTHTFSVINTFEAGYLWGHWTIRDQFIDNFRTKIDVYTNDRNYGSFVLHGFLGFGWDCNFNRNRSHIALKLGYEMEDWFNQFQIFSDTSGSQNNDLVLQGITFGLRFDF